MDGGGGGGDRNDMVTMAKCAGSQVMAQSSDIARMKYTDTCKNKRDKENYIFH